MGYIQLTTAVLTPAPNPTQTVTIEYKLSSSGTYITWPGGGTVNAAGNFVPVVNITGLTDGATYDVRVTSTCGGDAIVEQHTIPNAVTTTTTLPPVLTTTTSFGSGDITLTNLIALAGNSIVSLSNDTWTSFGGSGEFPIEPSTSANGTHIGFTGSLDVNVEVTDDARVEIYLNGGYHVCFGSPGSGPKTFTFPTLNISSTDTVEIVLTSGDVCP